MDGKPRGCATTSKYEAAGTHSITAAYSGDAALAGSTSTAIAQVVSKYSTTTTVISNMNPSTYLQAVTFTATVSPTGPYTLTGTVSFKSGSTTLGTVTLSGGTASYTTSTLTAGTKSITAVYNGDANDAASTSAVLSQIVNKVATTTSLVSAPNPSTFQQTVTFTATVSATGATPTGTVTFRRGLSMQ